MISKALDESSKTSAGTHLLYNASAMDLQERSLSRLTYTVSGMKIIM